jgi:hypothetical protein
MFMMRRKEKKTNFNCTFSACRAKEARLDSGFGSTITTCLQAISFFLAKHMTSKKILLGERYAVDGLN